MIGLLSATYMPASRAEVPSQALNRVDGATFHGKRVSRTLFREHGYLEVEALRFRGFGYRIGFIAGRDYYH
jgi:hypothetical protein